MKFAVPLLLTVFTSTCCVFNKLNSFKTISTAVVDQTDRAIQCSQDEGQALLPGICEQEEEVGPREHSRQWRQEPRTPNAEHGAVKVRKLLLLFPMVPGTGHP